VALLKTARAEEFLELIHARLPKKTLRHSVSVAEFMASFATEAGITEEQAETAGVLHDYSKGSTGEELLEAAESYGIEVSKVQRSAPGLLHGPVAAEACRRTLGVTDPAIYDAIYWHTTGRRGLGRLGLALYVADFAEPLRERPEAEEARAILAADGFYEALRYVADRKLKHIRTKALVDPVSEDFHAWLLEEAPGNGG